MKKLPSKAQALEGRRVPTQERARLRVERILDAAAQIFSSQGHDAATMEAIAQRAETSIGSIYQFFPNKSAVFDALVHRYHQRLRDLFDAFLKGPLLDRPWDELLDASIDAITAFHEVDAGFRAVWVGLHLTETLVVEGEAVNRELSGRIAAVLAKKLPRLPARRRLTVATMVVEVASAMMIVSARRSPEEAKTLLDETKQLLRLYLAPYDEPRGR